MLDKCVKRIKNRCCVRTHKKYLTELFVVIKINVYFCMSIKGICRNGAFPPHLLKQTTVLL